MIQKRISYNNFMEIPKAKKRTKVPVIVNGEYYPSIETAAAKSGISPNVLKDKVNLLSKSCRKQLQFNAKIIKEFEIEIPEEV